MSSEVCDTSTDSFGTGKSSTSTLRSISTITSKKVKNAAKKKSLLEKRKEKKRLKKIEKNKIDKDDFYSKHAEFRTWLWEEKGLKFETLSAAKAKEHFKKFTKKWNSKKLPKQYYRGIDTCWFDGSPATQSLWAMPRQVETTPGSLREEVLDQRYSRECVNTSSLGTFGKNAGRRALQELQQMYSQADSKPLPEKESSETCDLLTQPCTSRSAKTSSSSLPETYSRLARPRAPRRSTSLTNMVSTNLAAVFEDELKEKPEFASHSHIPVVTASKKRQAGRSNSAATDISPQKLQKQDSYVQKIERASPSVFQALKISSGKKKKSSSMKQRPKSLCDSRVFESFGQPQKLSLCKDDSFRKSAVLSLVDGQCTPSKW